MTQYKKRQPKRGFTKIDYTLEQYVAEKNRIERITTVLEKMASVMEKFEQKLILDDFSRKRLEKRVNDLEVQVQKLRKKHGKK